MAFWSGETLKERLGGLVQNFNPDRIDCAAYTLTVGPDVFVTEDEPLVGEPRKGVRITLNQEESFKIPPGQFAFLITEESVEVPGNALAFISMKATYKFKGLVNVSGFHVDPGWKGPLVFSVYNAGPAPVHLRRGLPLFLIWYCDLDQSTQEKYKPKTGKIGLRDELMSNMSGQVFSPMNLGRQLSNVKDKQVELAHDLASFKKVAYSVGGVLATFFGAFTIMFYTLILEPIRDLIITETAEHTAIKNNDVEPLEIQRQRDRKTNVQEGNIPTSLQKEPNESVVLDSLKTQEQRPVKTNKQEENIPTSPKKE